MHPCEGVQQQSESESRELCGPPSLINEPRAAEHIALLLLLLKCFHRHAQSASLHSVKFPLWDESHNEPPSLLLLSGLQFNFV